MDGGILGFIILVLLIAAVAVPIVTGTNTSGWTGAALTIWNIVPLALIIVVLVVAFRLAAVA